MEPRSPEANPDCQHRVLNRRTDEKAAWVCGDEEFPDCHFTIRRIA